MAKPNDKEWKVSRRPWEWPARVAKARVNAGCPPINMVPAVGTTWAYYGESMRADIQVAGQLGNAFITWQDVDALTSRPYALEVDEVIYSDVGLGPSEFYTNVYIQLGAGIEAMESAAITSFAGELRNVLIPYDVGIEAIESAALSSFAGELRNVLVPYGVGIEAMESAAISSFTGEFAFRRVHTVLPVEAMESAAISSFTGEMSLV